MNSISLLPPSADSKNIDPDHFNYRDISIWIDNYDDVFSDFDPRPYSERNVSVDFLYEVKRVCHESNFHINELKLLVPERIRDKEKESIIVKRLHLHFK